MSIITLEKKIEVLEKRRPQDDDNFVPAEWITLEEGARRNDIQYRKEEESGINVEKHEKEQRARGIPEWMILVQRENRQDYYERKAKREAEGKSFTS